MKQKLFILFGLLALSSCGFSPMYGANSGGNTNQANVINNLSNIEIAIMADRSGQYLRNALMDRFYQNGLPNSPIYRLQLSVIKETISDFDITIDAEATRRQLKLQATMQLVEITPSTVLLNRPLTAVTSHNVLESEFSTLVAEQSARDAALDDLARQIERQLALYFAQ